jgi:hypothetical protein
MPDINAAKLWYIIATSYVQFQWHRFVRHFSTPPCPPVWKITDAIILRDDHDDFVNIRQWFVPDDQWEEDVKEVFPMWDDWKAELRCRYGDRKCRVILRPGDTLTWPPPYDLDPSHHIHVVRAPQGVLSATLLANPKVPGARDVDVTRRVQKYAGFNHDYHGTTVRVRDIFPMDDHDDNAERFLGLRIIDLNADTGLSVKTFSYALNEKINP